MFDEKIKKEQIGYLLKIKPILQLNRIDFLTNEQTQKTEESVDLISMINELTKRVEELEKKIESEKRESIRKMRVKEQIISLLQEHKRLTSSQLSNIIGLSRTRCNEYLKELSREGLTEGVIVGRQKFYKLVR